MTDIIRFKPRTARLRSCNRCGGVAEANIWGELWDEDLELWDEDLGVGLGGSEKMLVPLCLGCARKLSAFLADASARTDLARSDAEIAAVVDGEIVKWEEAQRKGEP